MADSKPCTLITGGSGYLGQFLIHALAEDFKVVYMYGSRPLSSLPAEVVGVQADFATGANLQAAFEQHGPFHSVINCVAMSQPVVCEREPEAARSVNVPTHLLTALSKQKADQGVTALLIHLSTDHLYDGSRALWKESDVCEPVNQYGKSKRDAEEAVKAGWPHSFILRSSLIFGPPPPDPVPRPLFIQFVDEVITKRQPTSFFHDEWRSPVYVKDIIRVVKALLQRHVSDAGSLSACQTFNMGGPERLSRVDMAHKVCALRGLSQQEVADTVLPVPQASVQRGVVSPPDISMCSAPLAEYIGFPATPFADAIKDCLPATA